MSSYKMFRYLQRKYCISIFIIYTRIIGANFKRSICLLFYRIIRVETLWPLSNGNVTNGRGLLFKYAGILSTYILYPDENLTLSDTYFLHNFGRNLEIMKLRSSIKEQFLNPINPLCLRSPLILSVPLWMLQELGHLVERKYTNAWFLDTWFLYLKKHYFYVKLVLIMKDFKKSKYLDK